MHATEADAGGGTGRRTFLTDGARWALAGLLVAGTAWATRKGAGNSCRRPSVCGACPVFTGGCDLPKAAAWRRSEARPEDLQ